MTKNVRKEIMERSIFNNHFNKCCTYENWCNDQTQRNYCANSLLRKTKQQYFKNFNLNDITNNKNFWRTKPCFKEKGLGSDKNSLIMK